MTLRNKILLLGLIAGAGMMLSLWLQYRSHVDQRAAIQAMADNIRIVGALSRTTHQLQQERGLSMRAASRADDDAPSRQIQQTDAALATLLAIDPSLFDVKDALMTLRTAKQHNTPHAVRHGYSSLVQRFIEEMERLTGEPATAVAKTAVAAHTHLLAAKEYLGQLRAILTHWITSGEATQETLIDLIRLKALHEEELRKFKLKASPVMRATLATDFSGPAIDRLHQTLAGTISNGRLPPGLDADTWWALATNAIDRLQGVENASLAAIEAEADRQLTHVNEAMRVGVVTAIGAAIAVFVLAMSAVTSLLRALDRALTGMERIAASKDFRSRIPAETTDEIGRISRSFNHLLEIAERLLTEKEFLAITDPLTGIHNRLYFVRSLQDEFERKNRTPGAMALILFDIDHFKKINDRHGHNAGDDALKAVTRLVFDAIRTTDVFCRWGGEEFVLLLRDDDCDAAMQLAEKLRARMAAADFPVVGRLTCSFGVAAWEGDTSVEAVVARADQALYAAKAAGRNQVCCRHGTLQTCAGRATCVERENACGLSAALT